MNQGLLKSAKIAESVAFRASMTRDAVVVQTTVATDEYIEWLLPQIFKKLRPMAHEDVSPFGLYNIRECAYNASVIMQKAQLKLNDGLLFAARIEFEDSSFGFLLLRTNKEIEAIDTDLKAVTASDFKKGLLAMLMHVTHDDNGETMETFYTFDTHFKKGGNDWQLFLNLVPIQDDYSMTTDLIAKLSVLIRESHGLNGLQRLQLQQIISIELCNQMETEFSIADLLRKIQYIEPFKALDFSLLSDLGLFIVDIRAVSDYKKMLSAKLKLDNGMIISYAKDEMPRVIRDNYEMRKIDINNTSNMFEVEFKTEIFE